MEISKIKKNTNSNVSKILTLVLKLEKWQEIYVENLNVVHAG